MQTRLVRFFQRVLQQDSATLDALSGYGEAIYFDQDNVVLIFSLKGLYQFMTKENEMNYSDFRKCVYAGNINEELQRLGGRIDIHCSHGKVEQNVYKLVHYAVSLQ